MREGQINGKMPETGASRSLWKKEKMKKSRFIGSIYLLLLVLLVGQLSACKQQVSESSPGNRQAEESSEIFQESAISERQTPKQYFTVESGEYLTEILQRLVESGKGSSVKELLEQIEQMRSSEYLYWGKVAEDPHRAFSAEGYIAPGDYEWEETATSEEVLDILLHSWEGKFSSEMEAKAGAQGYTTDEILIMASIVEKESAYDVQNIVKPYVAAVIRNRLEQGTALQMDVTIFYLQDALQTYRNPEDYEKFYDTYICEGLPAGPIGSPSLESVEAVLEPADTDDLFFVYDEKGNYYFAKEYEQHLKNCEIAGIF